MSLEEQRRFDFEKNNKISFDPKMHCQNCLSPESSTVLVDMRTTFFIFNDQPIDYVTCFTVCKCVKIEDEQIAKICPNCMHQLEAEYAVKCDQSTMEVDPDNNCGVDSGHPRNSINNDVDPAKYEIMTIDATHAVAEKESNNVAYQIVFLDPEIKDEPELIIEDEGNPYNSVQHLPSEQSSSLDTNDLNIQEKLQECLPSKKRSKSLAELLRNESKKRPKKNTPSPAHVQQRCPRKKYKCPNCDKKFWAFNKLYQHKRVHGKIKNQQNTKTKQHIECYHCQTTLETMDGMKRHLEKHFSESAENYDCHYCLQVFQSKTNLREHFSTHRVPKKYSCNNCFMKFFNRAAVHHHSLICFESMVNKPNSVEVTAPQAPVKIITTDLKNVPPTEMYNYKCRVCVGAFTSADALEKHLLYHSETQKPSELKEMEKKSKKQELVVVLTRCPETFKFKKAFKDHLISHSDSEKQQEQISNVKSYPCRDCSKIFSSVSDLSAHMLELCFA